MNPKEKAKELLQNFNSINLIENSFTKNESEIILKQCALICVDEIIQSLLMCGAYTHAIKYWRKVKKEIETL